jgi:hypothetical protein
MESIAKFNTELRKQKDNRQVLHNGNNQRRSDASLHDWLHNDKTDLRLYLLGTNHYLRKKQNIEVVLMQ